MTRLAGVIARAGGWFGTSVAVEDERKSATFAEVMAAATRFANALSQLAPGRSDRVALLLPNRLELVEIDIGILTAGCVKVPINTRLRHDERAHVINDSGAAALVFDASEEEAVAELLPDLGHAPSLVRVGAGTLGRSYEDVLADASTARVESGVSESDPSLILYTSGTTGRPKGATTSFGARLSATINMLANEIDPSPGDAMAHVGSMAHGSGSKALAHFVRGSRNVPIAKWDPEAFLGAIVRHRISHSFMVPTMIEGVVVAAEGTRHDLTSLRSVSYGGAPISPSRLARGLGLMGRRFVQVYGSCEAPHPVLVLKADEHVDVGDRLSSAGRETLGYDTAVVDTQGNPVDDGQPGELLVAGPGVMTGYWERPEATAEVLQAGWYHTGDVVVRDEEGFVRIVDRARDVIITGGYNVYPAELEAVLSRHPAVAEVAVIGVPDDHWGEAVKAVVVANGPVEVESIIDHCAGELAGYKRPKSVDLVESLPHGSTGKILRRDVRDAYWAGRDRLV